MARGRGYRLASDLGQTGGPAREVYAQASNGVARVGVGEQVTLIGGRFDFETSHAALLLDALPPLVRVSAGSPASDLVSWVLSRLVEELRMPQIGTFLMRDHLAH